MADQGGLSFIQAQDGTLVIRLIGAWSLRGGIPSAADVQGQVASAGTWKRVAFDPRDLTSWDSSVVAFLVRVSELCGQRGIPMDGEGLPVGVRKLLKLAEAVPERKGARREVTIFPRTGWHEHHRGRRLFD
jgi:phospholipid/cholesterol/gamma-HCH transport system permease protein